MEIERKFLCDAPADIETWRHTDIEQAYLCDTPVVRVRRDGDDYWLTYKSSGILSHEEYNLPLTAEAYAHLVAKADTAPLSKTRYRKDIRRELNGVEKGLVIELDIFHGSLAPLVMAEVEFETEADANAYIPEDWFVREVTYVKGYHNSSLIKDGLPADFSEERKQKI